MARVLKKLGTRSAVLALAALACLTSIAVLLLNPAARKGPLGIGPPAGPVPFSMKDGSLSLEYPANWVVVETPNGSHGDLDVVAGFIVSGRYSAYVTVARTPMPAGGIADAAAWGSDRAMQNAGYSEMYSAEWHGANVPGVLHEYTWWSRHFFGPVLHRCRDLYTLHEGEAYDLSFCSKSREWDVLLPYYDSMLQSLTFEKRVAP